MNKLPAEEKIFYAKLNDSVQPIFLSLSSEERADALAMSKPMQPEEAVQRAAKHDVYSLPLDQQIFYFKLTPKIQTLFLALSAEASDQAVKLSQDTDPNNAVKQAAVDEVSLLIKKDQDIYGKLNLEMQTLFLTLTPQVRSAAVIMARNIDPNTAVKNVSWMDAKRLPKDQQGFYEDLNPDLQTLFLILTPPARSMALQLTKSIDPNTAVQYANRGIAQHIEY